jgi:hypothetical protein
MPAGKTYENILRTISLNSSQPSVTFNSISQDYTDLILVGNVIASIPGGAVSVRANGLTSVSHYGHTYLSRGNNTLYSGADFSQAYGVCDWFTTPSTNTNGFVFVTEFLNYTGTHHNKTYWSKAASVGGNSQYPGNDLIAGTINTTSPITTITLSMQENAAQGFLSGTTFTLYGIKAA